MKRKIRYGNSIIQYSIVKSKRRKTSQITIDRNNVVVRTPTTKTLSEIRKIVKSKSQWIFKKQLEFESHKPVILKIQYVSGSKLPFLGRNYPLKITTNQEENSIKFNYNEFKITLTQKKSSKKLIKELYENWLKQKAEKFFHKKIVKHSSQLNAYPQKLVIKNLKNRWGSLTEKKVINLNQNLMKAPPNVIDYIILHELCHMKIKRHNHHFWDYVKKYIPNFKEKIRWLEENQNQILTC